MLTPSIEVERSCVRRGRSPTSRHTICVCRNICKAGWLGAWPAAHTCSTQAHMQHACITCTLKRMVRAGLTRANHWPSRMSCCLSLAQSLMCTHLLSRSLISRRRVAATLTHLCCRPSAHHSCPPPPPPSPPAPLLHWQRNRQAVQMPAKVRAAWCRPWQRTCKRSFCLNHT